MPPLSRKQFLGSLLSPGQLPDEKPVGDTIFARYANKGLPAFKKTTSLSLDQYAGSWTRVQAKHLLSRTTFGLKPQHLDTLAAVSVSQAVDLLLSDTTTSVSPPVNSYSPVGESDTVGVAVGEPWVESSYGSAGLNSVRAVSLKSWWIGRMINQELNIKEKMVFFWHNHFATQTLIVQDSRFSYTNYMLLHANALGNFKSLARAVTTDPAMLLYLNGYVNTKNSPDENYGRELQELFTLGKNNNPNYNEDDVKSAARVLTGWHLNSSIFTSYFVPQWHDLSDKHFSSFFGNRVITGRVGMDGAAETDELIDMIFEKSEAAHFLCTKLYRFFVYYNITDEIDTHIIRPLADLLIANNYEVKPVLAKLLKSEHFFDVNNVACYIKTPLDFYVGCMRTFEVNQPATGIIHDTYDCWRLIYAFASENGLDLGDPPTVAGWPAFHQSPAFYQCWINTSTLPGRMQFTDSLLQGGVETDAEIPVAADVLKFAKGCPDAADAQSLVNWMLDLLLAVEVPDAQKNALVSILLSGQANPVYWSAAWNAYIAVPDETNTAVVETRLKQLLVTLLRLPEFQLC